MGVIGAIKRGFGVATKSMGLVLILFVFNLIGNVASIPFASVAPTTPVTPQLTVAAVIFSILYILVSIFFQGASLGLVRDLIKEGKLKLQSLVSYGLKYYIRLLLLGLLIILIILIVALIAGLVVAATAPFNNPVITAIAIIIAISIAVITGLMYFIPFTLAPYALISEEIGVIESMKRSLRVAKNPFSRVFLLLLLFVLLLLISLVIGFILGFVIGLVAAALPGVAGRVLMAVATSIINSYLGIVMMASFMTYYLALAGKEKVVAEKVF